MVILQDATRASMTDLAHRVQSMLHDEQMGDDMLKGLEEITVSQGYAYGIPEEGDTILELLDVADKALYHVKENGRNDFVIYDITK